MVLGTVGYMAPEQVRGLPADYRSDIFAFGCVLHEMLSGRRTFHRDTAADTMTAILKEEPPDLPLVERHIPSALARIVERSVEKAPAARFQSTQDLAFALEALSAYPGSDVNGGSVAQPREPQPAILGARLPFWQSSPSRRWQFAVMSSLRPAPRPETIRFFVSPPEGWVLPLQMTGNAGTGALAVSADGRHVAFVGQKGSESRIWVRSFDTLESRALTGTEGGFAPFWSADNRSLGFFAGGKLKKDRSGRWPGDRLVRRAARSQRHMESPGVIVFSPAGGTRASESPGLGWTAPACDDAGSRRGRPRQTRFLPDGRHFLYRMTSGRRTGSVVVTSLDSAERTVLRDSDSTNVAYSAGHLLFLTGRTLMAQPFDPDRLTLSGTAVSDRRRHSDAWFAVLRLLRRVTRAASWRIKLRSRPAHCS